MALVPAAVAALVAEGHRVRVAQGAGRGVAIADVSYCDAGAQIVAPGDAWDTDLVVKVKEVQPEDLPHIRPARTLFSFQHLPGAPERARALAERAMTAIAFEMVNDGRGDFPLLAPMSVIAGRMAVEVGARTLGSACRKVLVLGAGHAGLAAAAEAKRRGMQAVVLTRSERSVASARGQGFEADVAQPPVVERHARDADLVVGAVFVPAQPTPKLLPRALVRRMRPGSMIVDVSIDAGGVAETSRATKHDDPTFVEEGVIHYGVANMPAAAPQEATRALSEAALPFVRALAGKGIARALREDPALRAGVLLWKGRLNHPDIAAEAGLPYTCLTDADLA